MPNSFTVSLPWPPRVLHPNSRPHWAVKGNATRDYRVKCGAIVNRLAMPSFPKSDSCKIPLFITFSPPNKRRRDLDGCLSAIKAGLDGLADAWGVDDSRFRLTLEMGDPVKGGAVRIEVRP